MGVLLKVAVLAVLQGLTEFLPVSSSGHLVIARHLLDLETPGALLEVALHAGTLVSVLVYYRRVVARMVRGLVGGDAGEWRYAGLLLAGTVPAAAVGLLWGREIEDLFDRPKLTALMLAVTGLVVLSVRLARAVERPLSFGRALGVGLAQALAILPGLSRSGTTIATARHLGVRPAVAAEFSLLLAVPCMVGACLIEGVGLWRTGLGGEVPAWMLGLGAVIAAATGLAAIPLLVKALTAGRFWWFGPYALAVGLAGLWAL